MSFMKNRILLSTLFVLLGYAGILHAQYNLVSTQPQNRTVVMEEFTGVNCGWCPQGHAIAQEISNNNPGTVLVNIHAGGFANPSAGQPDFRTLYGTALNNGFGANAYPSGMVNRYNGGGGIVVGRGAWSGVAEQVQQLVSPLNIGARTNYDSTTREVTVDIEVLYTSDAPDSNNFLSVVLLEDGVVGYQANYDLPAGSVPNYVHNHILRDKIHTHTFGDTIYQTTEGAYHKLTYKYTIPTRFNAENCRVAAFVASGRENIYQGVELAATGAATIQIGEFRDGADVFVRTPKDGYYNENITIKNFLSPGEEFTVKLSTIDAPNSWKTNLIVDGGAAGSEFTQSVDSTVDFQIAIVPSGVHGIGQYILELKSVSNPTAPAKYKRINVLTDVTDLIVTTGETVPNNVDIVAPYMRGLTYAQNESIAVVEAKAVTSFIQADAIDGVNNIFYTVGWTFPALTNASAAAFAQFLDNGGNMLIAGQDIGWDTWDGSGTTGTQAFYTRYLKARYLNDGGSGTTQFIPVVDDPILGSVGTASIVSVYGNGSAGPHVYPDEMLPFGAGASTIFKYENNKTGGVRVQTDEFKVVYLGVGLEMISETEISDEIVKLSHDWFYGLISSTEFDKAVKALGIGNAFPNPAKDQINIPLQGEWQGELQLELRNLVGSVVKSVNTNGGETVITIDCADLPSGTYFYNITDGKNISAAKKVIVGN